MTLPMNVDDIANCELSMEELDEVNAAFLGFIGKAVHWVGHEVSEGVHWLGHTATGKTIRNAVITALIDAAITAAAA